MSTYIKEIQATPTLSGKDAIDIVRQVLRTPSPGIHWQKEKNAWSKETDWEEMCMRRDIFNP